MKKALLAAALAVSATAVLGQMMLVDMVAGKVAQKYQSATCEQLWQNRGKPQSPEEQRVLDFLKTDQSARQEFFLRRKHP